MFPFLRDLIETSKVLPDRPAVVDMDGRRSTAYRELLVYAGKVNAWLRDHGIGREDVCAVYLPRGVEYIAVRIGIMMAGACCVSLEDLMGRERIDYVIKDCGCKVVFDREKWEEAMEISCCEAVADHDEHDLAFITYTSGSTGTPKGAAQEYGIYEYIRKGTYAFFGDYKEPGPLKFAEVAPQSFVSGVYTTVGIFNVCGTIYEVSEKMTRDVEALSGYFIENGIQHTFMTPTFIKLLFSNPSISLRAAGTGGEIVSGIYTDRFDVYNIYGSSEFGYPVCVFRLDKAYDNTPVGFPTGDLDIVLLDEEASLGDEGVLCIRLPFFRGYIGEVRGSFITINGREYYRTSDYVRYEDGRYIMQSRLDDMVKINGNRIDTKEVEAAVIKALDLNFCCVKLYVNNGIKALCAYHTGDKEIDSVEAAGILRGHIPEYMIPSSYIRLDKIPLSANGKIDKKMLPDPKGILRINPYAAPENELQKKLCDSLKKTLDLREDVGIDDDFFTLGGDSIKAMETLADCDISGLSVQMVYEGRCVRRIISLLQDIEKKARDTGDEINDVALNAAQLKLISIDKKYPGTGMMNLSYRFSIVKGADMQRLADAVNVSVKAHPAMTSTIIQRDGKYYQHFDTDTGRDYEVENMSDEELEKAVTSFVQPFSLNGEPLFRCRIISAGTKGVILFDVYHVICDGHSLAKFVDDVAWAYDGTRPPYDAIRRLVQEETDIRNSAQFQKDMEYFKKTYDHPGYDTYPQTDFETDENIDGNLYFDFDFESRAALSIGKKHGIGKGGLYQAACALAVAAYNNSEKIMFVWTWHGRSDARRMSSVGFYLRDIPIRFELKRGLVLSKLYEDMAEQIREGFSHGMISYWDEAGAYEGRDQICFLYQGDIREFHDEEGIVAGLDEIRMPVSACMNTLDVEVNDGADSFGVLLDYNAGKYKKSSMERFGRIFCDICSMLISSNPNTTTVGDIMAGISL
jgi:acyl-coenzyme A synthetase/AMP-(fatty) acid ligase